MLFLRVEDASGVRKLRVEGDPFVLGRGDNADVQLDEERASREHLRVTPVSGGAVIRDLGSKNGTWLQDRRIEQSRIAPGESVRVGDSILLLYQESPATAANGSGAFKTFLSAVVPAIILVVLVELAVQGATNSRASEVDVAAKRLEIAQYGLARLPADRSPRDPEAEYDALASFLEDYPNSRYAEEAKEEIERIRPMVARIRQARTDLSTLKVLREGDALPFAELYYRYEKLLESCSDLPEVAEPIREEFLALDASHRERLAALVDKVTAEATALAKTGEFGRAASLLSAFAKRTPAAAASYEKELTNAESRVNKSALYAYRDLMSRADEMLAKEKSDEAVRLLRTEAARFTGTRFRALLMSRAGSLAARAGGKTPSPEAEDELSRRRSYSLMAEEAEELAAAGYFLRAADKYAEIVKSVAILEIRNEFDARNRELRSLHALIEEVKQRVREMGSKFGSVMFGDQRFRVLSMQGDTLRLGLRKSEITRDWGALTPEEELSVLRGAKLPAERRLLLAIYCFYLSLRTDYEVEVIQGLGEEATRETAGRLYARKEGRPYPDGEFVPYKGRILTKAEHAEEIHRELIAKLRTRQVKLYERLREHATFRKLSKLIALRADLDKARQFALALIFDEKKYFYPYRDRMGEYTPVQKEVDIRVAGVREVWNNAWKFTPKADRTMTAVLEDIEEVNAELRELGVSTQEFERAVDRLTMYLGKTLTIRTWFKSRSELAFHEYNLRVLKYNAELKSVAKPLERKQVLITNQYRMMMGRRALALDDRLLKAARGHSEEMGRLGYFSHFSPTPGRESPDKRVKLQGYKGTAVSENIHRGRGDPEGAHYGWIHSSGHHRNLLRRFWTEMGTGQIGNIWTQNFGRTKPKVFLPEESEDK